MIKIINYDEVSKKDILARKNFALNIEKTVAEIIANVKENGDKALFEYTEKFDKVRLSALLVSEEEIKNAYDKIEPAFLKVLKTAAENIYHFHEKQKRTGFIINDRPGIVMGQKIIPINRAGLYVPGGTAAYPSTVLMNTIPAKIAGCKELVIVTPPDKNGEINPSILAAADIAGADKIFKVGGAQAIAALAFGTESIPKVDKIVGPGNTFVAEAKRQVYGIVSIDMIAGPSEILIISDCKTDPKNAAADLLSQAEHDKMASAILITDSMSFAKAVSQEIERQLPDLKREEIARASIENNGKIIVTDDIQTAIEIANDLAPEHLELCIDDPFDFLDSVRNAGSVFLGRNCPEALGDYLAGPNHTLPTSGTARFSSPLSVDDFIKKTQYTYFSERAFEAAARDVALFAEKEGLTAHAKSALVRLEDKK